jgi:ABC-type antimicrobial peptide transport system permease subunit
MMRHGACQSLIGIMREIGFAALSCVIAAAALQNILFKTNALDPIIYLSVAALLIAVSCFVPARRATPVNLMIALRAE